VPFFDVPMSRPPRSLTLAPGADFGSGGTGVDTVYDFKHSDGDIIQFQDVFADVAEAMTHVSQVGSDVVFTTDAGDKVVVKSAPMSSARSRVEYASFGNRDRSQSVACRAALFSVWR
jgi:hypothetical protein